MAGDLLLKTGKHAKYTSYRQILYHRFFVGLLVFIVISLLFTILFNVFSGVSQRTDVFLPVNLDRTEEIVTVKRNAVTLEGRALNCTYWDCFDVYKCGRSGHDKITIYIYPLKDYQTENGNSISQFSREFFVILDTIKRSRYYTPNPELACILVPSIDTLNQNTFSSEHVSGALRGLEQ